jgi:hypothetical protein
MQQHPIQWMAPEPLWAVADRGPMPAPAILRFATDDFMQELLNVMATDPRRLGEYRVVKETWRGVLQTPQALTPKALFALPFQRLAATRQRLNGRAVPTQGQKPAPHSETKGIPLKLYQPAHQRYYLVAANLICQIPGLPDRAVDSGKQQQVGFVMRRLLPPRSNPELDPAQWPEHAWVEQGAIRVWSPLGADEVGSRKEGEEVLPLFAINHAQDDQRPRRLLAGLVPVGKRDAYLAAAKGDEPAAVGTKKTARKTLLRKEVIEAWKGLVARALTVNATLHDSADGHSLAGDDPVAAAKVRLEARQQLQTLSWYVLLDLAKFLKAYVPNVWAKLQSPPQDAVLNEAQQILLTAIQNTRLNDAPLEPKLTTRLSAGKHSSLGFSADLPDALRRALAAETLLETAEAPFKFADAPLGWPAFLFPLADPELPEQAAQPQLNTLPNATTEESAELERLADDRADVTEKLDILAALIVRAMPEETDQPQPAVPSAAQRPTDPFEGRFVIRCVYLRPGCGPLHDDVVSLPTEPFQLAAFFDPDAPARPIRIGLPIDTTPGGLRKFDRNTAFVISDTLCGQIARVKGITLGDLVRTVLPWPLHKDLDVPDKGPCKKGTGPDASFGMICSLSIPIITLCALILLMIMVSLLDFIFRWLPYFIICFPLPGLRGKKPATP